MCDLCDRPDLTVQDDLDHIRELVSRQRFVVQGVGGSKTSAELSYTVGLTAHGLPELIVVGIRPAEAHRLLRTWGDYLLDESTVLPGETLCAGPFTMEAVEVARPAERLVGRLRALRRGGACPAAGVGRRTRPVAVAARAPCKTGRAADAGRARARLLRRAPAGPARRPTAPVRPWAWSGSRIMTSALAHADDDHLRERWPLPTPWDPALADAMVRKGVAVHEERVVEELLGAWTP